MQAQTNFFSALSLIVAPAVLTNASSVLIMSTSNRLARAVDRARELTTQLERAGVVQTDVASQQLRELRAAEDRMLILIRALRTFYVAIGGFASATLLSLIGAVIAPTGLTLLTQIMESVGAGAGVIAVGGLLQGALLLVRETRIAVVVLQERTHRLRAQFEQRQENKQS
jgi:hypothetical protein